MTLCKAFFLNELVVSAGVAPEFVHTFRYVCTYIHLMLKEQYKPELGGPSC